jgi:hypothetical protein
VTNATKTLTFAQEAFPPSMDPLKGQQLIQGKRVSHALYDRPLIFDTNMAPVPQLATGWKAIGRHNLAIQAAPGCQVPQRHAVRCRSAKIAIELVAKPDTKNTYSVYAGPITGATALDIVVACHIGVPLGLAAAYLHGQAENIIMRLADAHQALPGVLLAIIIVAVAGASLLNLVIVMAISGWSVYTRLCMASSARCAHANSCLRPKRSGHRHGG